MSLFSKILSLCIAQIIVIVVCIYVHLDDFEQNLTLKEQKSPIESNQSEPLIQKSQQKKEENIQEESKKKGQLIQNPVKHKINNETKSQITGTKQKNQSSSLTDEKVKKLFEKKKSNTETSLVVSKLNKEGEKKNADKNDKAIEKEISAIVKENRIIFKRLSTDVAEKSIKTIEKVANVLKNYPKIHVEVGGHTDAKGDEDVNAYISKHRALSVKKLLITFGIDKERLSAKGYGESMPIVKNDPRGYSILNRRVEFKVVKE